MIKCRNHAEEFHVVIAIQSVLVKTVFFHEVQKSSFGYIHDPNARFELINLNSKLNNKTTHTFIVWDTFKHINNLYSIKYNE